MNTNLQVYRYWWNKSINGLCTSDFMSLVCIVKSTNGGMECVLVTFIGWLRGYLQTHKCGINIHKFNRKMVYHCTMLEAAYQTKKSCLSPIASNVMPFVTRYGEVEYHLPYGVVSCHTLSQDTHSQRSFHLLRNLVSKAFIFFT